MTSAFGDLTVIANPHAGGGVVRAQLPALERGAAANGASRTRCTSPSDRGEPRTVAAAALGRGGRYLVAVGGDGTVQQVVNGMFDATAGRSATDAGAGRGGRRLRRATWCGASALPGRHASGAVGHLTGENTLRVRRREGHLTGPTASA